MKKGCMFNKKNKVSETMICRYIYITLTLIVVLYGAQNEAYKTIY